LFANSAIEDDRIKSRLQVFGRSQ